MPLGSGTFVGSIGDALFSCSAAPFKRLGSSTAEEFSEVSDDTKDESKDERDPSKRSSYDGVGDVTVRAKTTSKAAWRVRNNVGGLERRLKKSGSRTATLKFNTRSKRVQTIDVEYKRGNTSTVCNLPIDVEYKRGNTSTVCNSYR